MSVFVVSTSNPLSYSLTDPPFDPTLNRYDTLGFPLDLTQLMAQEQGVGVDGDGFAAAMALQKERSRAATRNKVWSAVQHIHTHTPRAL